MWGGGGGGGGGGGVQIILIPGITVHIAIPKLPELFEGASINCC